MVNVALNESCLGCPHDVKQCPKRCYKILPFSGYGSERVDYQGFGDDLEGVLEDS